MTEEEKKSNKPCTANRTRDICIIIAKCIRCDSSAGPQNYRLSALGVKMRSNGIDIVANTRGQTETWLSVVQNFFQTNVNELGQIRFEQN